MVRERILKQCMEQCMLSCQMWATVFIILHIFLRLGKSVYQQLSVYCVGCSFFAVLWFDFVNKKISLLPQQQKNAI